MPEINDLPLNAAPANTLHLELSSGERTPLSALPVSTPTQTAITAAQSAAAADATTKANAAQAAAIATAAADATTKANAAQAAAATDATSKVAEHNADIAAHGQTVVGRAVNTATSQAAARTATDSARNEVAQSSSYTAVAGERYVITSSATVTDPASPSNGQAYSVRISAGTATVGGVPYSAVGSTIVRAYNAGSWSTSVVWPNASNFGPTIGASRVVLLGDSITNQNGGPGPYTTFPTYNAIAGWFTWANIRLGHRLAMVQNAGKAGDRTDQILARFSTEVAPFAPHMVMLMAGTNDCAQSVSYATIIANLTSLYNRISEIGATCIAFTIPPIATANLSDANRTTLQRVNRWIKEQGRQRSKFIVVDLGSAIVDTTTTTFSASWTPAASTTSDGTHPAADGAVLMGRLLADALSPYVAASSFLATGNADTNNLITNGALSGTAGSWPTGWGGSAESSTWTYPARTDSIAGTWAQVAMTNFLQLIGTNITSGFSEGQKVYLTCEYELDYTPGQLRSFYLALYRNGANVAADPATFVQALNVPSKGVLETPAYTIPAGTTALRAYIFLTMSGTGVAATLRVARFGMHLGDPLAVN